MRKGFLPKIDDDRDGNFPHSRGLMGRIAPRGDRPFLQFPIYPEKIIFLNADNLDILKGYKAGVEVRDGILGRQEIHIVITGLSPIFAKKLFDDLKALSPNEIRGI